MIFRHKKLKTAMAMMAILSIFGGSVNTIYADAVSQNQSVISVKNDEIHKLNVVLKHETKDEESSANKYVQRSYLKVENNKKYMIIVLSSGQLMKSVVPTVNGKEVECTNTLQGEMRTITFEIPSLDEDIRINFEINPFNDFIVNAACRVEAKIADSSDKDEENNEGDKEENDTITGATPDKDPSEEDKDDSIEEDKEESEDKEDDDSNSSDKDDVVDQEKPENDKNENEGGNSSNNTYKNGYYQIKNIVVLDNEVGYSMVRNILNETSNLEIKNGKYYLTFEMAQSSLMKDIVIKSNSKILSYTKTNVGNDTVRIKLEIPNLSSVLNISAYVTAMGRTVDFDLKLNQSTLKFVSSNEEGKLPENNNSSNVNDNNGSGNQNNSNNNNSNDNLVGNNTIKGKLYTIKNQIVHDNETGKSMARKYLNETSKIEEIDGQLYLTLTFTGVDLMQNHKFYVNGSLVSHQVTSSSSSSKSYRFKINSLNDDIKVNVFIVPMNTTVEFGVKLLKSTYTFVKDFEVSDSGKLPQTGSLINSETLFMGGSLITALGTFLGRKKRK